MKRCVRCLMPETAPHIEFNEEGLCLACQRRDMEFDHKTRYEELAELCKKYRRSDGKYDCIVPVSGGKDSFFQLHHLKTNLQMTPLLVSVTDEWEHTKAGEFNAHRIADAFNCDCITLRLSSKMVIETSKWGYENIGSSNWAVDAAIYAWPIQMAIKLGIKLVVYGENVAWVYGHSIGEDTYSAKKQIENTVVNIQNIPPIKDSEKNCTVYPTLEEIEAAGLEPIYLSYFTGWDGLNNAEVAKEYGFRDLIGEWDRTGYIDWFWQVDSIGYLYNYYLKYLKYGYSKATDVASHLIRCGRLNREDAIELVRAQEGKLDTRIKKNFMDLLGYTEEDLERINDTIYNKEILEKHGSEYVLKKEHQL